MVEVSEDDSRFSEDDQRDEISNVLISSSPSWPYKTSVNKQTVEDDSASLSGSAHNSTGPEEAIFDHPTRTSSPQTSNGSDEEVSIHEDPYTPSHPSSGRFAPLKQHSPFRNASSVRAMQLDTTPPHVTNALPPNSRNGMYSHSRQTSTPRSTRSQRGTPSRIMHSSPTKSVRKEHPLVLLHVTILPLPHFYPMSILESVLAPATLANWQLLQEKTNPTVLHRGVLIPHPREDYDLLEERLLESLELKQPRILKCGHFRLSPEEEADLELQVADDAEADEETANLEDADICLDCGRRIRDGRFGDTGAGSKRWNLKVYAANGLMKAGAWAAAWREMERVDVEILPWIDEATRRELESRTEEERRIKEEEEVARKEEGIGGLDDARLKEIYGQEAQSYIDGLDNIDPLPESRNAVSNEPITASKQDYPSQHRSQAEVPLSDLLRNFLLALAQDRRNLAILLLSLFVIVLAVRSGHQRPAPLNTPQPVANTLLPSAVPSVSHEPMNILSLEPRLSSSAVPSTIGQPALEATIVRSTDEDGPEDTASPYSGEKDEGSLPEATTMIHAIGDS